MNATRSLSTLIQDACDTLPDGQLSLAQILEIFHERGFGFFLLIFALPMALPIPVPPGINILLALPLLLLTAQQFFGAHKIWFPKAFLAREVSADTFKSLMGRTLPWLKRLEILIRPRLCFMTSGITSKLIGITGFVMALCICIPIPLSNTVPSFGIALMAIGTLTRDGLAVLSGMLIGLGWVILLAFAFIYFGEQGAEIIKEFIRNLL